ncbi:hypothetical protein HJFPF1_05307 [Paramyrothecium foliicola]|nr:hypothetical protein HJFPF1_05307 [Paramyrothecium foliicola]
MSTQAEPQSADLYERILAIPPQAQHDSPLFGMLPAEIRSYIFKYALTDYPDPSPDKRYNAMTCYTRPAYFAPSKTDTQLLRTCRAVYNECWFMPLVLREHMHWATHSDRAPPDYQAWANRLDPQVVSAIARHQALLNPASPETTPEARLEVERMRVFAQMYKIEDGSFAQLLREKRLLPRELTLTIRHADWWYWESDNPLSFNGKWIPELNDAFPSTVTEFHIELESVDRKKYQVQEIAKQMMEKWFFRRPDGVILYADAKEESNWNGTSTWHGQRWVRDEVSPGVINYHITRVTFRPEHVITRKGAAISPFARALSESTNVSESSLRLHRREWSALLFPNAGWESAEEDRERSWDEEWDEYSDEESEEGSEDQGSGEAGQDRH